MQENIIETNNFGTIKWFDYKKGYGFITPDIKKGDKDVFVHITVVKDAKLGELKDGQRVEYYTYKDRKRVAGYIVKVLS